MSTIGEITIEADRDHLSHPLLATIPLPSGLFKSPEVRLGDIQYNDGDFDFVELEPFGDRNADGSYPFAFVRGTIDAPKGGGVFKTGFPTADPVLGFEFHPTIVSWIQFGSPVRLQLNGSEVLFTLKADESSDRKLTRVYLLTARLGRLVSRLRVVVYSGSPTMRFDHTCVVDGYGAEFYSLDGCQPITGDMALVFDRANVRITGEQKSTLGVGRGPTATRVLLMDSAQRGLGQGMWDGDRMPQLVDGQGPTAIEGVIVPHSVAPSDVADLESNVRTIGHGWAECGNYGVFGAVPKLPSWCKARDGRSHFEDSLPDRAPFGHPYWPAGDMGLPDGSAPGDQKPIRVVPFVEAIHKLLPDRLEYALQCMMREVCRPNTYVERDGSLFSADKHPDCWFWSGRPWARTAEMAAPDHLGRPIGDMPQELSPYCQVLRRWTTFDIEHWLTVYMPFVALLTGHPWAMERLEYTAELAIASRPMHTGNPSFDGTQACRAEGRWMRDVAHYIKVVQSDDLRLRLRDRLRARAKLVQTVWEKQWGSVHQPLSNTVARWFDPMLSFGDYDNVNHPTDRLQHANPWQEGILMEGVAAAGIVLGDDDLMLLGDHLAWTVVNFGCVLREDGSAQIAIGIRAGPGEPVFPELAKVAYEEDYLDGGGKPAKRCVGDVDWADGTAYLPWASGGLLYFQGRTARIDALAWTNQLTTMLCERVVKTLTAGPDDGDPREDVLEKFGSVREWEKLPKPTGVGPT